MGKNKDGGWMLMEPMDGSGDDASQRGISREEDDVPEGQNTTSARHTDDGILQTITVTVTVENDSISLHKAKSRLGIL